jgi:hypothetical protein
MEVQYIENKKDCVNSVSRAGGAKPRTRNGMGRKSYCASSTNDLPNSDDRDHVPYELLLFDVGNLQHIYGRRKSSRKIASNLLWWEVQ